MYLATIPDAPLADEGDWHYEAPEKAPYINREDWLTQVGQSLAGLIYAKTGKPLPRWRAAWGFPSAGLGNVAGECWAPSASPDGTMEIFIAPHLADGITCLATLLHELCHVHAGIEAGHGPHFISIAMAVGLVGPWRATSPGPALHKLLTGICERWPLPAPQMTPGAGNFGNPGDYRTTGRRRKSRPDAEKKHSMVKVSCECGYTCRITPKWVRVGLPTCPCGGAMSIAE